MVKRYCSSPGCPNLQPCSVHGKRGDRGYNRRRGSSTDQGYTSRWRKVALAFRRNHPLCAWHLAGDVVAVANVVDHVVEHKGDSRLFWDPTNWAPLCKECHGVKTRLEHGLPSSTERLEAFMQRERLGLSMQERPRSPLVG